MSELTDDRLNYPTDALQVELRRFGDLERITGSNDILQVAPQKLAFGIAHNVIRPSSLSDSGFRLI